LKRVPPTLGARVAVAETFEVQASRLNPCCQQLKTETIARQVACYESVPSWSNSFGTAHTNMKNLKNRSPQDPDKAQTGIAGFDEITHGGLPRGRTTLVEGGPGSGKTIMSLQWLVNGASLDNEPGIFVAFEETSERIFSNGAKFGWDLLGLEKKRLFFLNAQLTPDMVHAGSFDLSGMLAILGAKAVEMKARRIVLDALDVVLALLNDPHAAQREVYRLHEWLLATGVTAIITSKIGGRDFYSPSQPQLGFMQFMVDCAVILNHEIVRGVSQRSLRVIKYRGSAFAENESPFLIGQSGLEVAGGGDAGRNATLDKEMLTERISSGVARLDVMLGGGLYRGAAILITGVPGTAKSTLSGAFIEAACLRGEKSLYISFDSDANEVVRNLASVRIHLERHVKKGLLRLVSARAITGSAEIHLMQIKKHAREHGARCLVIDPVSALSKAGNEDTAYSVAERLVDWAKANRITLLCTSLLPDTQAQIEATPLQISTIADTWIHLNYLVHAGERNRGLSIIKSRGTAHSNQVRELILSSQGVTLADAYTAGGEVLMGTMRWEKELAVRTTRDSSLVAAKQRQVVLDKEERDLEVRLATIQRELEAKRLEKQTLSRDATNITDQLASGRTHLRELRGMDK
jgi:circadian clock protein KaiC